MGISRVDPVIHVKYGPASKCATTPLEPVMLVMSPPPTSMFLQVSALLSYRSSGDLTRIVRLHKSASCRDRAATYYDNFVCKALACFEQGLES